MNLGLSIDPKFGPPGNVPGLVRKFVPATGTYVPADLKEVSAGYRELVIANNQMRETLNSIAFADESMPDVQFRAFSQHLASEALKG